MCCNRVDFTFSTRFVKIAESQTNVKQGSQNMAIVTINRAECFESLVSTDLVLNLIDKFNLDEEGSMKFHHFMEWDDFTRNDKAIWTSFLRLLGIKPEDVPNFGKVTFESYATKWYNAPVLLKESGKIVLQIGSDDRDNKAIRLPIIIDEEKKNITVISGQRKIQGYFSFNDYPDPENPDNRIKFPLFVLAASKTEREKDPEKFSDVFHLRVNIRQTPADKSEIKEDVVYYNHEKFDLATREYDEKTILNFLQESKDFEPSASLSTLVSELIIGKQFPNAGICIPFYGVKPLESKFGKTFLIDVDLTQAWICGSTHKLLPNFQTWYGSKKEGTAIPVASEKVKSVMIGGKHTGASQIEVAIQNGLKPSKQHPWILWIKKPNTSKKGEVNPNFVPEHSVFTSLPAIPMIKASAPTNLLPPVK